MPTNSNIVKTINNPNRFGPQPGGSLMNRTVPNPAQQANRPGPMNSAYLSSSMSQRTVGATPMMKVNGRIEDQSNNVASWNYTPGSLGSTPTTTTSSSAK
ncbi:3174_t:CDS:2 [Entrophospora sp. SA101]|nr:20989_t:CDS:2 [Entrophospora sp. SA101]CAJ0907878.1 4853_t:CDS:2 [Entrophospora sp. SA101]CAJ0909589.1 3174_t:CDS:2 [Entrophospora sp. SA101]CAJ0923433.1 19143_t:CDS:2 [Entrophospora sp. SA101]